MYLMKGNFNQVYLFSDEEDFIQYTKSLLDKNEDDNGCARDFEITSNDIKSFRDIITFWEIEGNEVYKRISN